MLSGEKLIHLIKEKRKKKHAAWEREALRSSQWGRADGKPQAMSDGPTSADMNFLSFQRAGVDPLAALSGWIGEADSRRATGRTPEQAAHCESTERINRSDGTRTPRSGGTQ
jgi:hypothetical protein